VHCARSACKKKLINSLVTVLMHSNQSWFCCFFGGLEHQPSPHGWAESSPFLLWAGTSAQPARLGWGQPCFLQAGTSAQPMRLGWVQPCGWANTGPAQSISFYLFICSSFLLLFCVFFFIIYIYFWKLWFSHGFSHVISTNIGLYFYILKIQIQY